MITKERILNEFIELVSIDSPSYGERALVDAVKKKLEGLGFAVREDDAARKINGNAGNIYAFLDGSPDADPLLFCAHTDTVEPSRGKRAVVHEDGRITSAKDTVLGSDDLSGIVELLEGVRHLQEECLPHRPVEVLFNVAEEVFGKGAKAYDYEGSRIISKEAYVIDMSGHVGSAANRAPTIIGWTAQIRGRASHAGFSPEAGINAITSACAAIAKLEPGQVDWDTTMNIGTVCGGTANNIVPELCTVNGEVRSLDHEKAYRLIDQIRNVFEQCAGAAKVSFTTEEHIVAYHTPQEHSVVRRFQKACAKLGFPGDVVSTLGGSDNNVLALHGIKGIVLSSGMQNVHSTQEFMTVDDLMNGAALVAELLQDLE